MDKLEKAIADLNEIKEKIIPIMARIFGSGFSSVFICEKTEEKINNAIELLKKQKEIIDTYHKADMFLAVHGWQWKETTTGSSTNPMDGEQE